jgi:hypothetical protein
VGTKLLRIAEKARQDPGCKFTSLFHLMNEDLLRILEAIYETYFIEDSYGFRPERGCHDALRELSLEVETGRIHYIVEADIRGFFDCPC